MKYHNLAEQERLRPGDEYKGLDGVWRPAHAWASDGVQNPHYEYRRKVEDENCYEVTVKPPTPAEHITLDYFVGGPSGQVGVTGSGPVDGLGRPVKDTPDLLYLNGDRVESKLNIPELVLEGRQHAKRMAEVLQALETAYIVRKAEDYKKQDLLQDHLTGALDLGEKCRKEVVLLRERCVSLEMECQALRRSAQGGHRTREQAAAEMKEQGL